LTLGHGAVIVNLSSVTPSEKRRTQVPEYAAPFKAEKQKPICVLLAAVVVGPTTMTPAGSGWFFTVQLPLRVIYVVIVL
jgi:hypothetical protein